MDLTFEALKNGDPKPFVENATAKLNDSAGIHSAAHLSESCFQVNLNAFAYFCPYFEARTEVEISGSEKGYADLVFYPKNGVECSYVFELKYLSQNKCNEESVLNALKVAKEQLSRYQRGDNISKLQGLHLVACVFSGTKLRALSVEEVER